MKYLEINMFIFIMAVSLVACETAPLSNDEQSKITISQFPSENWDGQLIEYAIAVRLPDVKGKSKIEAEKIKKFHIVQGLKKGMEFLFRLPVYNGNQFHLTLHGTCQGLDQFKSKKINADLSIQEANKTCDDMKARTGTTPGDSVIIETELTNFPKPDIESRGLQALFSFSDQGILNSDKRLTRFVRNYRDSSNQDKDSFLTSMKDDKGKEVLTLVFATEREENDTDPGHINYLNPHSPLPLYAGQIVTGESYDLTYVIPYLGLNEVTEKVILTVPNQKISNIFQSSAPNLNTKSLKQIETIINEKFEPYGIRLIPAGADSESPIENLIQEEINSKRTEDEQSHYPNWLKHVDIEQGKEVWGFLLLSHAKIESEKRNDANMVIFKITIDMNELLNFAKAEKYEKFMAK